MGCLLFDVAFTAALFLTGLSFGRFLLNLPLSESLIKRLCPGETAFSSLKQYLYFAGVWILFLSAMLLSPSDRTMLRDFPVGRKNLIRFLPGLITGFAANAVCVCGALLTRSFTLQPAPGSKGQLLVFLPVVLLQAGAEELAFRYYLYQKLKKYRSWHGPDEQVNLLNYYGLLCAKRRKKDGEFAKLSLPLDQFSYVMGKGKNPLTPEEITHWVETFERFCFSKNKLSRKDWESLKKVLHKYL